MTQIQKKGYFIAGWLGAVILITGMILWAANRNYGMEGDEVFNYISATSMGGFKGVCYLDDQTWYEGSYFQDSLVATGKERFNLKMVWENQAMDVHPPFYYVFLNAVCSVFSGQFSRWYGIGLNLFFVLLIHAGLYLLLNFFLKNRAASLFFSTIFCCSQLVVGLALFIRMYVLLMAFTVWQTWYHLFLYQKMEKKEYSFRKDAGSFVLLAVLTVLGGLTHYYFLVWQCLIAALMVAGLWVKKSYKNMRWYLTVMVVSGVVYLALYPTAIEHIFFKYQGRDAMHQFLKESSMFGRGYALLQTFNGQLFKGMLYPIFLALLAMAFLLFWKKMIDKRQIGKGILFLAPAVIFFWGTAKASPYLAIRYVCPVTTIIYAWILVCGNALLKKAPLGETGKKAAGWGLCALMALCTCYFGRIPLKEPYFLERDQLVEEIARDTKYCVYVTGDEYNWKMWEDYITYPLFQGLFFIDGQKTAPITDQKLKDQEQLLIYIDTTLDYEEILSYLQSNLGLTRFDKKYTTSYVNLVLASKGA